MTAAHPEPVPTPDSADDDTVGEREACDLTCTGRRDCPDSDLYQPRTTGATEPSLTVTRCLLSVAHDRHQWTPEPTVIHRPRLCPGTTPPADDANRAPVSGGLDEGERESLGWAEMLTHQECAAKKHPDWFIDSGHNILCPWCRAEAAEAERDTERREAGAKALRDAADELWGPSYTGGIQWGRTDYVGWLRARADALTSDDGSGA